MLAKIIGWLVGIILVLWVVSSPAAAGHAVHNVITSIFTFAGSVSH